MNRASLLPLLLSLIGVSMCAAACFVMLTPYQVYRLARRGIGRIRHRIDAPRPAPVLVRKNSYS